MQTYLSKIDIKSNLLNFLFFLIPVSFIAGNLVINLNFFLLCVIAIIFFGLKIFSVKLTFLDKLIISFFIFSIISGFFNELTNSSKNSSQDYTVAIKTISYLRYLIIYFVVKFLIIKNIINFKYFFLSCFISTLFVSFDLFFQAKFGHDVFGYVGAGRKLSGPFGDELIAGGYLQRFSIFSFFLLPFFFKINNKNVTAFFFTALFVIFTFAIIISGNRMPLVLFISAMILMFIFEKKTRKYFFPFFFLISILFISLYNLNKDVKLNINVFVVNSMKLATAVFSENIDRKKMPNHYAEFESFYDTWLMNRYIGGGIKSFRINCPNRKNLDPDERKMCNSHPHNYYLEILADLGIVGFIFIGSIFAIIIYLSFIKKYFLRSTLNQNNTIIPFIFVFIVEIFPIKSTGSFFTTGNSTFIFLTLSIIVGFIEYQNRIESKS